MSHISFVYDPFLSVIDGYDLLEMVHLHHLNNGGDPVPVDRVARSCGWVTFYSKEFQFALFQFQCFLRICYFRNKLSLTVTEAGRLFRKSCENKQKMMKNEQQFTDMQKVMWSENILRTIREVCEFTQSLEEQDDNLPRS